MRHVCILSEVCKDRQRKEGRAADGFRGAPCLWCVGYKKEKATP